MSTLKEKSASRPPSSFRAWTYLVWLSWQRQARARQMVWIALGLLVFSGAFVAVNTAANRWDMHNWRWRVEKRWDPQSTAPPRETDYATYRVSYREAVDTVQAVLLAFPRGAGLSTVEHGITSSVQIILDQSPFLVFTQGFIFRVFLQFLLPLWSLSFATEALGGDREANSLVWLLTRPMSRPAIFLAKFVALLPWSLFLNVGGFALLCLLAGSQGRLALRLFWPAVVFATLAFSALFFFMGAFFRRPAVVATVYAFFLEVILGNMPGYLKRVSINFYTKCMMLDAGEPYGIHQDRMQVFLPVDGMTAQIVLTTLTVLLLGVGMMVFARSQYQDAA